MDKFSLRHTVLYAKGWYKRYHPDAKNKTIWDDLQKTLEADGYTMWEEKPNKSRIAMLIISQVERLDMREFKLSTFYSGTSDEEVWKYGYYTKTNAGNFIVKNKEERDGLPDYDRAEAVVRYCLSAFSLMENSLWEKCAPDYVNVLPKKNGISDKKVAEVFK